MQHTVHLREGVKFHDGAEVTAHDAMFSIEKVMEDDSQTSFIRELTPMLESLETPDDYTLVINCNEPCLFGLWIFSGVRGVDGDVVEKAYYEDKGEAYFAQHPIGSGPYRFESQVLGSSVTVEAVNESHFRGGMPKYQTIEFQGIPEETTRIANLKAGDVDIIDTSRERVDSLQKDGFNIFYKERADLMGAYFFQQWEADSPFYNRTVREALNLAINREVILEHIFGGQGGMAFYPFGSYGFDSGVNPDLLTYPYDLDRSVALLQEQGYSESNPLQVKMAIYPFGGISEFPRMIEAIAADLENTGVIKVELQPTEYGTLRDQRRAKQLPGWIGPWATTNRAAPAEIISITRALFDSRAPNTTYGNPGFDPILDEAFGALDEAQVPDIISRLHQFLYDDNSLIPLFEVDTPFATSDKITGWDLGRDSYDKNLDSLIFPNFVPN
jgi:peptide/nickel transport system substrate-binding protein